MAYAPVDTAIAPAQIKAAYDSLQEAFASPYTMVEADFLAVSTAWRDMPQVQKLWSDTKNPQNLEAFAQKNAEGFFVKKWLSLDELASKLPKGTLRESSLSPNKSFTAKSKEANYFIRINAMQKKGEKMSLEAATPQVKAVIIQKRKIAAWDAVVNATYQKELQAGRISLSK